MDWSVIELLKSLKKLMSFVEDVLVLVNPKT